MYQEWYIRNNKKYFFIQIVRLCRYFGAQTLITISSVGVESKKKNITTLIKDFMNMKQLRMPLFHRNAKMIISSAGVIVCAANVLREVFNL